MAMALGSAVGTYQQGMAQAQAAEYNAKIADRNRKAVNMQTRGEVADRRVHNRRVIGAMRAAFGANGFEMAGSPMDVIADTTLEQSYDVEKIKYQGAMKAEGYKEQRTLFEMEAKASKTAAGIGLASGLLSGVGSMVNGMAA